MKQSSICLEIAKITACAAVLCAAAFPSVQASPDAPAAVPHAAGLIARASSVPYAQAEQWRQEAPGFEYRKVSIKRDSAGTAGAMHQIRFSLDKWKLVVCRSSEMGKNGASVKEFCRYKNGAAAVNGLFFDKQMRPMGYIQQNGNNFGTRVEPAAGLLTGVFEICRQQARLFSSGDFSPVACETAFQAGPRLINDGAKVEGLLGDADRLSGIAIDRQGRVIIYSTEYKIPLTLSECRDILTAPESEGGVSPRWALNLDGGSSSGLYADCGSLRLYAPGLTEVPTALVVKPR